MLLMCFVQQFFGCAHCSWLRSLNAFRIQRKKKHKILCEYINSRSSRHCIWYLCVRWAEKVIVLMRIQRTLCAHTFKVKQHFGYSRSAAKSTKFIYSQKISSEWSSSKQQRICWSQVCVPSLTFLLCLYYRFIAIEQKTNYILIAPKLHTS